MGGPRGKLVNLDSRNQAIELVKEARTNGARKKAACDLLGIHLRTLERWEKDRARDQRKGAKRKVSNKLTGSEREKILQVVNSPEDRDLSPAKIVPHLASKGVYIASESSIYRLLRENKQLAHRGRAKPKKHSKPTPHEARGPNQVWSWDITYLPSQVKGIYYYLYLIVDIYSRKITGWSVHETQNAEDAAHLVRQSCIDEDISPDQLSLHADNGGPMKGQTLIVTLQELGVVPSYSRPSVSDDNPYSESLFKTLKYHSSFPAVTKFADIFEARSWVIKFTNWYNNVHMHSGLKFITPNQRHLGLGEEIMSKRHQTYLDAKQRTPNRWSGKTRNWELPSSVSLNPNKRSKAHKSKEFVFPGEPTPGSPKAKERGLCQGSRSDQDLSLTGLEDLAMREAGAAEGI